MSDVRCMFTWKEARFESRAWADWIDRHRQCKNRRDGEGSQAQLRSIRVADMGLLHHVHWLRVDDVDVSIREPLSTPMLTSQVPYRTTPHLHLHMYLLLGHHRMPPISCAVFWCPSHPPRSPWHWRSCVQSGRAFLPVLLLQTPRASIQDWSVHLG